MSKTNKSPPWGNKGSSGLIENLLKGTLSSKAGIASRSSSPDQQQYSLRWNDFFSNIASTFGNLLESEFLADVTLACCDGKYLKSHKLILSACSPFFHKLLQDNPCQHPIIILKDVVFTEMESILNFMYRGEVQIHHDDLNNFLKTAQTLQIKGLTEMQQQQQQQLHQQKQTQQQKQPLHGPQQNIQHPTPQKHHGQHNSHKKTSGGHSKSSKKRPASPTSTKNETAPIKPVEAIESFDTGAENGSPSKPPKSIGKEEEKSVETFKEVKKVTETINDVPEKKQKLDEEKNSSVQNSEEESIVQNGTTKKKSILVQALEQSGKRAAKENNPNTLDDQLLDDEEELDPQVGTQNLPKYKDEGQLEENPDDEQFRTAECKSFALSPSSASNDDSNNVFSGSANMSNRSVSQTMEILRVRATDPRPCPKCGKIYRSAHTLRTHLEDKHTICPGYRCVLCGTVAKSRNSLHSHMSRQHRGISTKDLPVLPMPAPFDPHLAAKLLAKAGVKFNNHNSPGNFDIEGGLARSSEMTGVLDPSTMRSVAEQAAAAAGGSTGSAILDTYLQFIAENSMANLAQHFHNVNTSAEESENDESDNNVTTSTSSIKYCNSD